MTTHAPDENRRNSLVHGVPRVVLVAIVIIVALLVIARIAAPRVITHVVNQRLAGLPDHIGRVEDVDLVVLKGVVHVKELVLESRETEGDAVVRIPLTAVTVAWRPLLDGRLEGVAVMERPEWVMFNDEAIREEAMSKEEEKRAEREERAETVEKAKDWQDVVLEAFPMELHRFEMRNARIRFVDRVMNPHPEVVLEKVGIVITGLNNRPENNEDLPATLTVGGVISTGGDVFVDARVNPFAAQPRFEASLKLENLELPPLNDFTRFYGKADVKSGRFTLFVEVMSEGGHYHGHLRPFFEDLEFKAVEEEKNILKRAATAVASGVSSLLESDKDKVATEVPFEGNFADNQVDIWTTIRNLLRNAFVQALREGFTGRTPSD